MKKTCIYLLSLAWLCCYACTGCASMDKLIGYSLGFHEDTIYLQVPEDEETGISQREAILKCITELKDKYMLEKVNLVEKDNVPHFAFYRGVDDMAVLIYFDRSSIIVRYEHWADRTRDFLNDFTALLKSHSSTEVAFKASKTIRTYMYCERWDY